MAELIAVRRCVCDTSGVRNKIPQNITLYKTPVWRRTAKKKKMELSFYCASENNNVKHSNHCSPTKLKHNTIHNGTNTTSQLHATKPSNFNGKNTNCNAFTAINNSSSNERSCLTDQTQAPTLATLPKISGTKTRTHKLRPELRRSHANNSNINRIRCNENDISIAL